MATTWKGVYLECYIKVEEYLSSEDIWRKRYEVVANSNSAHILASAFIQIELE